MLCEASGITKNFGDLRVLADVNLTISEGEVVAITGPSGAGKTTLLLTLGSLERPDSGIVRYEGEDIYRLGDAALAKFRNSHIGFVFQFHQLLPEFSLIENVAMPALIGGMPHSAALARAGELLDYLGLKDRASHRPSQLSGGECQRGAVARALINRPRIVLADEPSGSLDSHNRRELHDLFFALRRDMGQTFVIVTHDDNLAAETDRIVRMRDGRIIDIENLKGQDLA